MKDGIKKSTELNVQIQDSFSEKCFLRGEEGIGGFLWQESGWFVSAGQMQYGTLEHSVLHFPHGNCQSKRLCLCKEITTKTSY